MILDGNDFRDYIGVMEAKDVEQSDPEEKRLGPPRLTRLDVEDDAAVLRVAEEEERPVAAVLRRLVRQALRREAA